jgi:hypothetical protein
VADFLDGMQFAGLSEFPALESEVEEEMTTIEDQKLDAPARVSPKSTPVRLQPRTTDEEKISTPVGKNGEGQVVFAHVSFDAGITKEFVSSLKKYLDYLETTLN